MRTAKTPRQRKLARNTSTDVCIVGAGIAGLSVAYNLAVAGKRVVVLDQAEIGGGESGRTTAQITCALDRGYSEIERLHGAANARLAGKSHCAAIGWVEDVVQKEGIECEFEHVNGYLYPLPGEDPALLQDELDAIHAAGLWGVERVDKLPIESLSTGPAILYTKQAQFHPLLYLSGLAEAILRLGGAIHTRTRVKEIAAGSVTTDNGKVVKAEHVVVATHSPINDYVTMHTKQASYRSYVLGFRIVPGSVPRGLYWDTANPYHYVRLAKNANQQEILLVGGEDHKTGQEKDPLECFSRLHSWTRQHFPNAGSIAFRWSGQVQEPNDGLPFIGRNPGEQNVYIVTGDSGNGMTSGTMAGTLLTDLILGNENPYIALYDPARITLKAAAEFAKENLNVAAQYADLVTPGDIDSVKDLAAGDGAILREGMSKLACYRDAEGTLHKFSALCPHLQCVVQWNKVESTWDCPCHGSRFAANGDVVNGPALGGLAPAK